MQAPHEARFRLPLPASRGVLVKRWVDQQYGVGEYPVVQSVDDKYLTTAARTPLLN